MNLEKAWAVHWVEGKFILERTVTCSVAAVKSSKCGHGFSHLELLWQDDMYDGVARLLVIFSDTPSDVTPPPLWLGGTFSTDFSQYQGGSSRWSCSMAEL